MRWNFDNDIKAREPWYDWWACRGHVAFCSMPLIHSLLLAFDRWHIKNRIVLLGQIKSENTHTYIYIYTWGLPRASNKKVNIGNMRACAHVRGSVVHEENNADKIHFIRASFLKSIPEQNASVSTPLKLLMKIVRNHQPCVCTCLCWQLMFGHLAARSHHLQLRLACSVIVHCFCLADNRYESYRGSAVHSCSLTCIYCWNACKLQVNSDAKSHCDEHSGAPVQIL